MDYIISAQDTIAVLSIPTKNNLSNEKVFTGRVSLKMSNNNPYGFTLRIFKGSANDKIVVSCRSYGYGGYLDFQEYPNGINYWSANTYKQKDSLGWKFQEVQFILPHNITKKMKLGLFEWFPDKDSIYMDNFKVCYFEKD
jgi:hypothetical protein